MKDFPSCFGENGVQVADSSSSNSGKNAQNLVTCIYQCRIRGRTCLITVTWAKTLMGQSVTVGVDDSCNQSLCKVEIKPWLFTKRKGSKSLEAYSCSVDVFWDLASAKFGLGPEALGGFYVSVVVDKEMVLLLGDMKKEAFKKTNATPSSLGAVFIAKKEHVFGKREFATKARLCSDGSKLTLEELNRGETRQTERRLCVCVRKQQMSISMALFSPPISSPLQNSNLIPKISLSLLSTKRLSLVSLTRASSDNGTSTPASATTVEAPTPKPASVEEVPVKSPAESPSASENGAVGAQEIDDMTTTTMTEIKFQDAKWVNGTWDLKQFEKEGKTDWDSVIVAEAKRRKWLEDNPETTSNDEPVLFDTSIIPWWAWMKRYHLPEAELLNGRAAMVGFFMAYFVDSLTGVGLVDQMGNFFCKTLLFVAVAGVLFIRKNEDLDKLKGLIEETTLYDKQWQAAWKEPESSSSSTVSSKK